jgi:hypothetical protein
VSRTTFEDAGGFELDALVVAGVVGLSLAGKTID